MKSTLLLLFGIIIFQNHIAAQKNLPILIEERHFDRQEENFTPHKRTILEYDQYDNEISKEVFNWHEEMGKYMHDWRIEKEYSEDGARLIREKIISEENECSSYSISITDYTYHRENCINSTIYISYDDGIPRRKIIDYYSKVTCQLDSTIN